jgi:hypothetical protein
MEWYGLDYCGSGYEPVEGFCEHRKEPSDFIEWWEFLE